MEKKYILGISGGCAGLIVAIVAVAVLIHECRRRRCCCKKTTSPNDIIKKNSVPIKLPTISMLVRQTHLFDDTVFGESSLSTFRNIETSADKDKLLSGDESYKNLKKDQRKSSVNTTAQDSKTKSKYLGVRSHDNVAFATDDSKKEIHEVEASIVNKTKDKRDIDMPKETLKMPLLPQKRPIVEQSLRQEDETKKDSCCYLTPIEISVMNKTVGNSDYEEIRESQLGIQQTPHGFDDMKQGIVAVDKVLQENACNNMTKCKMDELAGEKSLISSKGNEGHGLNTSAFKDHKRLNSKLDDINLEIQTQFKNKKKHANTPATKKTAPANEFNSATDEIYNECTKQESQSEHIYSELHIEAFSDGKNS